MSDDEVFDVAIEWLESKWGHEKACPYCGTSEWAVGNRLPFDVITVTCVNCASIVMIDPDVIREQTGQ